MKANGGISKCTIKVQDLVICGMNIGWARTMNCQQRKGEYCGINDDFTDLWSCFLCYLLIVLAHMHLYTIWIFPPQSRHFKLCSVHEKWLTLSYCHSFWWHRWSQVKTSAAWNRYRIHSEDRSPIANTLQQYDIHNRLFNNLVYFVNTMNSFKFMGPIFYLLLFSKAFWEWKFVIMTRGFNELIIMKKKLCF